MNEDFVEEMPDLFLQMEGIDEVATGGMVGMIPGACSGEYLRDKPQNTGICTGDFAKLVEFCQLLVEFCQILSNGLCDVHIPGVGSHMYRDPWPVCYYK